MVEAVVPDKVQTPLNVPVLFVFRTTVPTGAMNLPGELSVTVTVQEAALPAIVGVLQTTAVVVVRLLTVRVAAALGPLPL